MKNLIKKAVEKFYKTNQGLSKSEIDFITLKAKELSINVFSLWLCEYCLENNINLIQLDSGWIAPKFRYKIRLYTTDNWLIKMQDKYFYNSSRKINDEAFINHCKQIRKKMINDKFIFLRIFENDKIGICFY